MQHGSQRRLRNPIRSSHSSSESGSWANACIRVIMNPVRFPASVTPQSTNSGHGLQSWQSPRVLQADHRGTRRISILGNLKGPWRLNLLVCVNWSISESSSAGCRVSSAHRCSVAQRRLLKRKIGGGYTATDSLKGAARRGSSIQPSALCVIWQWPGAGD